MASEERSYEEVIALAQLTIQVDQYIRETGVARSRPRSIDRMLSDIGVKTSDIARLLGKTERAVNMQLASNGKAKKNDDTPTLDKEVE